MQHTGDPLIPDGSKSSLGRNSIQASTSIGAENEEVEGLMIGRTLTSKRVAQNKLVKIISWYSEGSDVSKRVQMAGSNNSEAYSTGSIRIRN